MPIRSDLLTEIQNTLGAATSASLTTSSDASDLFEAYVFSLAVRAAQTEGASVSYRDRSGKVPTNFIFRTSPGYIYSTTQAYCHAVIHFQNKPALEAHIGVRVVGKSEVLHECDVAILEQSEAERCRQRLVSPRSAKILMAVECKFYSTSLQLHLARSFLGLLSDLSAKDAIFVSNISSDSIEQLLSGRKRKWEHNLIPSATLEINRLCHEFQTSYKQYKAKR
jgi:hypothetical protein